MAGLTPAYLRCDYLIDPLGIDVIRPRLSWVVQSDQRNQRQTGCQELVSDRRKALDRDVGTLWDSGKVATDETAQLYAGQPLKSRLPVFLDKDGAAGRP